MSSDDAADNDEAGDHRAGESDGPALVPLSNARAVETVVVPEKGLWAVDIVVVFDDGVVRKRIQTYRSEALATLSARYIKRGAERDIGGGPVNG